MKPFKSWLPQATIARTMAATLATAMVAAIATTALTSCTGREAALEMLPIEAQKPSFAIDVIRQEFYSGQSDDLATAGLGLTGLRAPAPRLVDPLNPSSAELRQQAYYQNFKALLALSEQDGYGKLYARAMQEEKNIAGSEYTMPVRYSDHAIASLLMVQVPVNFNHQKPCLVVTASSGSRGIYGATGVVGAWALHQGCAVATTDKGTGTGFHWLDEGESHTLAGTLRSIGDPDIYFKAPKSGALEKFTKKYPFRVATKHAHSGKKVEQDWGHFALQAAQFGFYILNEFHREPTAPETYFTRANTLTIGAAISNGGASIVRAAELDTEHWIDGIAVSEPNVFLPYGYSYSVNDRIQRVQSLPEQAVQTALFAPCASLAAGLISPLSAVQLPLYQRHFATRCQQLAETGLLDSTDLPTQSQEALNKLYQAGMLQEASTLLMTGSAIGLWETIAVNYINSYLGTKAEDHLCNASYAYVNATGQPIATPGAVRQTLFSTSSGIIPTGGLNIINDASDGGPASLYFSKNAKGQSDLGFDVLRCLAEKIAQPEFIHQVNQLAFSGNLHHKPALIVQGRSDSLIQVNHHGRAYAALNQQQEGSASQLRYIEISAGQHFDAFLNYPPLRAHFVPMHFYFEQALEMMLTHLQKGTALPPSQAIQSPPTLSSGLNLDSLPGIALNEQLRAASGIHQSITVTQQGINLH